ncbi:unnamed protein product, partial [Didymodactylos carnosus]
NRSRPTTQSGSNVKESADSNSATIDDNEADRTERFSMCKN